MKRSFADTMKTMSPYFPGSLVSTEEFSKLMVISKAYPSLFSYGAAFETRLHDPAQRLDMFFSVSKQNRTIPAGLHPELKMDERLFDYPTWQRIKAFFSAWGIPDSNFERYIHQVFLEFDVGDEIPDVPIPAIFLQFEDDFYSAVEDNGSSLDTNWIFEALEILKDGPISGTAVTNIQRCFSKRVPGTRIDHLGVMASRTPEFIRTDIARLSMEQLYEYLEALELGVRINEINKILPDLYPLVDFLLLALDVSDDFSPRIGIELRFSEKELNKRSHSRWERLLDALVDKGLSLPEKRDGLLSWMGKSREIFDPELYRFMIYRNLNHIKLVFLPDQPVTAKAYFSFIIQPFNKD